MSSKRWHELEGGKIGNTSQRSKKDRTNNCSIHSKSSEASPVNIICHNCRLELDESTDRVKLLPCQHVLCTLCALESHIERRHTRQICPCCNKPTKSNKYIRASDALIKSFNTYVTDDEMKNDTPAEWLITHHKWEIKATNQHNQAFVLCASMAEIDKDGELRIDTITSTFVLKVDIHDSFTVINPMQALAEVGAFFSFLHEPIAKASVSQQKHLSVLRPREFLELRCKHQRLIDRAMHALSTGEYEFNAEL
jgi:hypothetical protein